jgi:ribonuclease HII
MSVRRPARIDAPPSGAESPPGAARFRRLLRAADGPRRQRILTRAARRAARLDLRGAGPLDALEREYHARGIGLIAGVDEAGRGPLAGPVAVAAVVLAPGWRIAGLDDSKKLTARRREELAPLIRAAALAWRLELVEPEEIDQRNILQATLVGMQRAVAALPFAVERVLVDGNRLPQLDAAEAARWRALVRGDSRCAAIAAASILAKVARDARMRELDRLYPGYGFAAHKGYPTRAHQEALARLGPSPVHRRSFRLQY